jgi:amino acid transporter
MLFQQLFAKKSLETLLEEARGENRLRRILGPVGLTSLGVGAIIGAGIFVMTGRVAANDAGPAILLSFTVAGIACALAAFCYAEFAAMAPVAGSAYTYAYATLGELFAWIIGWDLILEYAMSCATVAASWSKYLNAFLDVCFHWKVPDYLCNDPFSTPGAILNLPAMLIILATTIVLVIGIRESAASNTALVLVKLGVVLFVIAIGFGYIHKSNWFGIPAEERKTPEQVLIPKLAKDHAKAEAALLEAAKEWVTLCGVKEEDATARTVRVTTEKGVERTLTKPEVEETDKRIKQLAGQALAVYLIERARAINEGDIVARTEKDFAKDLPQTEQDKAAVAAILERAKEGAADQAAESWGILGTLGLHQWLSPLDEKTRGPFMPYGFSGMMVGAALVFFAFIGFDSISTHAEEAAKPQRDVPIGILSSLFICTLLYIAVAAVITGMEPYPKIDTDAAVATAFARKAVEEKSSVLTAASGLISVGALAGMTSVLLITFLSQARIFLAMARDRLLPHAVFGVVHPRFRTPHMSTMITGGLMCVVAGFTPILVLEEMVNIGTLFAFIVVCAAVLIMRIKRPDAERPFRCPLVMVVAPLGILINFVLMLFLTRDTWIRLIVWLVIGLIIYFSYGMRRSILREQEARQQA